MSFQNHIKRIGFACKYMHPDRTLSKKLIEEIERPLNQRATTITWLNRQTRDVAVERLWELAEYNIQSCFNLVEYVSKLEPELRMVRLGSGLLPAFTEKSWSWFWQQKDVQDFCAKKFAPVGELARKHDVRLSFHPGQFCVLASDRSEVVERSIEEFEYHVDCARWMGYGKKFQDFKCNVHISGKKGPAGIKQTMERLSTEAKNIITIENDEMSWGLDASLELVDTCALVLDIHHHWVREGEYIQPNDDRFARVIDSWRGVRPVIHYSVSRENLIGDIVPAHTLPDMNMLLTQGFKKAKLRAHSDMFWNTAANEWASSFTPYADIMCESKAKQIASQGFFYQNNEIIS